MIVCSKAADTVVRMAVGREKVAVADIASISERMLIDAGLTNPKTEAFVVSESDIVKPKVRQQFLESLAKKHVSARVLFLARPKSNLTIEGADKVLVAPKATQVAEALSEILESIAEKSAILSKEEVYEEPEMRYVPKELDGNLGEAVEEIMAEDENAEEELPVQAEETVPDIPQYTEEQVSDALLERIKACASVADISIVSREITASRVVKQLLEENSEYSEIEAKLKAYQQKINAIMLDATLSLEDKLSKVRAVSYDRAYYAAKGTTILEQRVEGIVRAICDKVQQLVEEKDKDLDRTIIQYSTGNTNPVIDFPMLSSLLDTRANIVLDIALLGKEIKSVFLQVDGLTSDTATEVIQKNTILTGTPVLDNVIEMRGARVTLEDAVAVVNKVLALAVESSEKFAGFENTVKVMNDKLVELLKTDDAIIEQQAQVIKYLTSQNVEDTVVANTFIKKALRIYVAPQGVGRTMLPYSISKLRSRTNANVLYMDLTGESKLKNYGVKSAELADWVNTVREEPFCIVENGVVDLKESSTVQRLANCLVKAADYYRVINVVVRPDQKLLFETLVQDAISVNYITNMNPENLDFTKELIVQTGTENVAQRVFLNMCPACTENVVRRLGLEERLNVECLRFPYVQQIVDCALNGVDPTDVDVVETHLREVMKRA